MADHSDAAAMRTQNRLGNGQTHPRAMQKTVTAAPVEFVEDVRLLRVINALPVISDGYQNAVGFEHSPIRTGEPAGESTHSGKQKHAADLMNTRCRFR